ncbi:novel immune-type receptor 9 [Puntigrus tetrazona]|uniref:novel immune-type receptor 9 n=1 Tax=Puntigrus tetrazona TaxID=1606681 RepID=UPI001C89158C|nr:novel immune-type receptor 9 [Puntigrus tetrazona]
MINVGYLLLFLIGLAASHLNNPLVFAKLGETFNMSCFYESQMAMHFSWYKHEHGKNPRLISTIYKNLQLSDSATYYCGSAYSNVMEFVEGTELIVQGVKSYNVVNQPDLIPSHLGDSVSLTCTVLNRYCVGNNSVYWIIQESEESRPGFISVHGTSLGRCEWSFEAGFNIQRCVYSFSKKDLAFSDSETYSCAVAACGEILFWNGTKLDIIGADSTEQIMTFVILSIVRTLFLLIIIATITFWYCMNSKRISKDGCSPSVVAL